jgi:hypothetical protein
MKLSLPESRHERWVIGCRETEGYPIYALHVIFNPKVTNLRC